MNKHAKALLWALAAVALSTMGVRGCISGGGDPDLLGVWRQDLGEGCYDYDIFTNTGVLAIANGHSGCGTDNDDTVSATYLADTSVTPHRMDIYEDNGDHFLMIYEVDADTLKIASNKAPAPRPTDFTQGQYAELTRLP